MPTTTTHDPDLGGAPRLIVNLGGTVDHEQVEQQQVFLLQPERTTLGTGAGVDVHLDGTDEVLGEIVHDAFDEYVYVQSSGRVAATVNGEHVVRHPLRTGDRLELGSWSLTYFREEKADHGRPYGGRQGGEGAVQQAQAPRSAVSPAAEPAPEDLTTERAQP